ASQEILKLMKRPANSENVLRRLEHWRDICPGITIRSTFIVGFPGETETHFNELLDFLDTAQLDRVGCFMYSEVEGAEANKLENHVDEETKQDRLERFMLKQAEISANKLKNKIASTQTVLVDDVEQDGNIIARSYADAPDIDGVVIIDPYAKRNINAGDFIDVEITNSDEHDLYARLKNIK
ncbi:Ribosomal protein S12p Asp88 (E. coli) methylthiotransferase, partial [hydrothermal vent metagenome]